METDGSILVKDIDKYRGCLLGGAVGDALGYPVESDIGYPTPGSFGTYCGVERNIPTLTIEVDENKAPEELLEHFVELFDYFAYKY